MKEQTYWKKYAQGSTRVEGDPKSVLKAIQERKKHTKPVSKKCANPVPELDKVGSAINYFSRKVSSGDLWNDDLKQVGSISYLSSRKIGYTKSQALVRCYYRILNCYIYLTQRGIYRNIVDQTTQLESDYFFDLFPVRDSVSDEIDTLSLLSTLRKKLNANDFEIIVLLLQGYRKNEIALTLNTAPYNVSKRLRVIKSKLNSVM